MHPEGGHVPIQALPGDKFDGYSWGENSPFHGKGTVEGMASAVGLTERLEMMTGQKNLSRSSLADLDDEHEIWYHAANALANLCTTLVLMTSVERIVFGGGIMIYIISSGGSWTCIDFFFCSVAVLMVFLVNTGRPDKSVLSFHCSIHRSRLFWMVVLGWISFLR